MTETARKLATIQRIAEIKYIPDADLIQAYRVGGWWVVSKKGEFAVDSLVTYLEIDSFVPTELAPFLSKGKEPREYMGVKGERLVTRKFKKQVSQGLILPLSTCSHVDSALFEGLDVTFPLNILKWEAPEEFISADAKGNFPSFIPKTVQERIQNLSKEFDLWLTDKSVWQKTEKIHGMSLTCFVKDGEYGVCSRNLELKEDENNTYWKIVKSYDLINKIKSTGRNLAFQGEGYGSSISGNMYELPDHRFALYAIYDIDAQCYLPPDQAYRTALVLGVPHVPHLGNMCLGEFYSTMQELIDDADGASCVNTKAIREGYVYKNLQTGDSFKVIGAGFLIKKG